MLIRNYPTYPTYPTQESGNKIGDHIFRTGTRSVPDIVFAKRVCFS
jgi:hypothetical protein